MPVEILMQVFLLILIRMNNKCIERGINIGFENILQKNMIQPANSRKIYSTLYVILFSRLAYCMVALMIDMIIGGN